MVSGSAVDPSRDHFLITSIAARANFAHCDVFSEKTFLPTGPAMTARQRGLVLASERVAVFHRFRAESRDVSSPVSVLVRPLVIQPAPGTFPDLAVLRLPSCASRPLSLVDFSGKPLSERLLECGLERFPVPVSSEPRESETDHRSAADPGPIERRPKFAIKDGLQFSPTRRVAHSRRQLRSWSPSCLLRRIWRAFRRRLSRAAVGFAPRTASPRAARRYSRRKVVVGHDTC